MTTVSHGKPYAGNSHVRFEEGDSASAEPSRKSLLHNKIHEIHPLVKEELLSIYQSIAQVCEKHGVRFWLGYGTLLGAVRHRGFIPWDDDFDLVMLRDDYEKFLKVCSSELPAYHKVVSICNCRDYPATFCKVQESRREVYERIQEEANYVNPHGLYVDIFPLDGVPDSRLEKLIDYLFSAMAFCRTSYLWRPDSGATIGSRFVKLAGRALGLTFPGLKTRNDFALLYDKWAQKMGRGACRLVRWFCPDMRFQQGAEHSVPSDVFSSSIKMPFEGIMMPVPKEYDTALKIWYGSNYMTPPPLEKRVSEHSKSDTAPWIYGPVS